MSLKFLSYYWRKSGDLVWNAIVSSIESFAYSKPKGLSIFKDLKASAPDVKAMVAKMREYNFLWNSDPLGGCLGFTSKSWVTCAKKTGDCDDFARLWYDLLENFGKVWYLYTKKKSNSKAHLMTVFLDLRGNYYLLSNRDIFAEAKTKEEFLNAFYGSETDYSFFL